MASDSIPRYPLLGTYHRRERETVHTLACCLGELDYLQDGLAQVRALLKRIDETVRTAASSLEPHDDQRAALSITRRARDRAILWLLYRHRPIFVEAEADLSIPLHYWANTLDATLDGGWDDAVRYLDAATGAEYLAAGRVARPRWGISNGDESFDALAIERMDPRADPEEYANWVYRIALADAQARAAPIAQERRIHPGKRPLKGGRPKGQTNRPKDKDEEASDERYKRRVTLCNLWRQTPTRYAARRDLWRGQKTIKWATFVREVDKSGQLASHRASQKSIERATADALRWGAPADGVPLDPGQFVLG